LLQSSDKNRNSRKRSYSANGEANSANGEASLAYGEVNLPVYQQLKEFISLIISFNIDV